MSEEIMNLSTIVTRKTINIASKKHKTGKVYELANLADLGPYEHAIIYQRNEELEKLAKAAKPTQAQERQVKKMLDDTVSLIVRDLESAVLKELTSEQKQMVVFAWSAHLEAPGAAEGKAPSRRTTGRSSRDSKSSTAATRKRGSTSRAGS